MDGDFWFKVFIVVLLLIGQGVLWTWAGWQAQQLPWWPIKSDLGLIAEEAKQ